MVEKYMPDIYQKSIYYINYDKLWNAMHHPENIQTEEKRSTESYIIEKIIKCPDCHWNIITCF